MSYQHNLSTNQVVTATTTTAGTPTPTSTTGQMGVLTRATAVTGTTPSCVASIEWSTDGINYVPATPADTLPAITTITGAAAAITIKAPWYRTRYTITGTTPSFTLTTDTYFT